MNRFWTIFIRSLLLAFAAAWLVGCSGSDAARPTETLPTPVVWTPTAAEPATPPTATPLPASWVVVQPAEVPPSAQAWAEGTQAWAAKQGLRWVSVPDLDAATAAAPVAALVALPPVPVADAIGWAVMHPQTRVLAFAQDPSALPAHQDIPPNVSVVVLEPLTWEQRFFLAGYLTTLASANWRAGLLYTSPPGYGAEQIAGAFRRGARYWCGPCVPAYPPMVAYPFAVEVPPGVTDATAWQDAARRLLAQAPLEAVYVRGEGAAAAIAIFQEKGVTVIWDGAPNPDAAVQVYADPWTALDGEWATAWLDGQAEAVVWAPWQVQAVSPEVFSPGRKRLVQDLLTALQQGRVAAEAVTP